MKTQQGELQLMLVNRTRLVLQALAARAQREAATAAQQVATHAGAQIDQFFDGLLNDINSDLNEAKAHE